MLSIILPAKNESAALVDLLPRLRAAQPQAEIIVVDDGSTDDLRELNISPRPKVAKTGDRMLHSRWYVTSGPCSLPVAREQCSPQLIAQNRSAPVIDVGMKPT